MLVLVYAHMVSGILFRSTFRCNNISFGMASQKTEQGRKELCLCIPKEVIDIYEHLAQVAYIQCSYALCILSG